MHPQQQQQQQLFGNTISSTRIHHAATGSSSSKKQSRSRRFLLNKRTILLFGSTFSWFLLLGAKVSRAASDVAVLSATTATTTIPTAVVTTSVVVAKSIAPQISIACELQLIARLIFAAISGSVVGWERSASKHSAGVRTMALVSLGAAAFTICSAYGFTDGKCDPSRMAANVASGVGFLGAGVITTQARASQTESYNIVHGLTTAAAIWLSAALGVACAVGLYLTSFATTLTTVAILRLGKVPSSSSNSKQQQQQKADDNERVSKSSKKSKKKKTAVATTTTHHHILSDTHDTSGWDEVQKAIEPPPGPLGDGVATTFRHKAGHTAGGIMPNDWLSARFENETMLSILPDDDDDEDPVLDDFMDCFQQNTTFTNATYSTAQELEYNP